MDFKLDFQPSGIGGKADGGETLLDAARRLGAGLVSPCGGYGVCGKCRVRVLDGEATLVTRDERERLSPDELAGGFRLACETRPLGDLSVSIPDESAPVTQVVAVGTTSRPVGLDPAVKDYYVELAPPVLENPAADSDRLKDGLKDKYGLPGLSISFPVLQDISSTLRDSAWKVTASVRRGKEVTGILGGYSPQSLGAAFDVGTTTIEGCLCDLGTGEALARDAALNPQAFAGADVMSRISYALSGKEAARELQTSIAGCINRMLAKMAEAAGIQGGVRAVSEVALVGNTVMHHLLLGLPVGGLGVYPFIPALSRGMEFPASDIGIDVSPGGYAFTLPVLGGFVGADHTAVLLADEPYNRDQVTLILDAGTNGEIALGNSGRLLVASCATGPAFEGAQVRFGMRASDGAIERVVIDPDTGEASYRVIGGGAWSAPMKYSGAKGICGSGMVDAVAQMFGAGIIGSAGAFVKGLANPRLMAGDGSGPEYVIAWGAETVSGRDITVSADDVRAVLLAKAALSAGTRVLMAEYGVDKVDRIVLAGAFGNFMDIANATAIGMLPPCPAGEVRLAGNAAADGARMALLSMRKRNEAAGVAARAEYMELSLHPGFNEAFIAALGLPGQAV